ncbi:hypothetical protein AMAG_16816 [Allomyces macrogynus ATCC 38327]|uniref:Saccharopine dehydrogenase NADP binding domain-containing protein n=1 Tax=Allomyces macrogynus (strain ATCC 38327) TaxID=578462 RepID=A0A0L0TC89_ALLM3|nr:hypothetical protein AMAG_16816 [Allomyces macrogynus ATCC 38327]|eukprot:KNE72331.1 hypothetical protein AMAG_16816 [Allomyces macrogynus ATCC 38327]
MASSSTTNADSSRAYDIVVFGATGFTGKLVAKHLLEVNHADTHALGRPLKVALAARSQQRLEQVLADIKAATKLPLDNVGLIIADVGDNDSLLKMCGATTLVLNCVGPFRFFGEPVVAACVGMGTNYMDITGEPEFIDRMFLAYNQHAAVKDILIVPACGFDSIPADIGVLYAKKTLVEKGVLPSSIEMYLEIDGGGHGVTAHFATYESAVHGFGAVHHLRNLRKQVTSRRSPVHALGARPKLISKPAFHKPLERYTLPFPGSDASVVRMSQECLAQINQGPAAAHVPVHFSAYMTVRKWWKLGALVAAGTALSTLAKWKWGRKLLLTFPRFFTFGLFSHKGPSETQLKHSTFTETFVAKGFTLPAELSEQVRARGLAADVRDVVETAVKDRATNAEAVVEVSGPEMGYVATPMCMVAAATTLLREKMDGGKRLPAGVLTPAAALANTDIIQALQTAGLTFRTVRLSFTGAR